MVLIFENVFSNSNKMKNAPNLKILKISEKSGGRIIPKKVNFLSSQSIQKNRLSNIAQTFLTFLRLRSHDAGTFCKR